MDDALHRLADLPGVPEAVQSARAACTRLRWHQGLRQRTAQARAETTARAARASAALEGAELPVEVVRDILRGAASAPDDAVGRVVSGAVRATCEAQALRSVIRTAPLQALARLHTAAAAGLLDPSSVGRPRSPGEEPRDLPGPAPQGAELAERLDALAALMAGPADVPALVVAALVHGELVAIRPFVAGSGVVARAAARAVIVDRGLDPTGVAVVETGYAARGLPAYAGALAGYVSGSPQGVAGWLVFCAAAVEHGAAQGAKVADAVLAGRLTH